jgi:glyoxylase-like metal-dependent hydrolase (beta-lactamase superfamily II)
MRIVEDLYGYVWQGRDNNCNSYVLAGALGEGKHAVIDPGHLVTPYYGESGLEHLLRSMQGDGLTESSIRLVILTHSHPDHCEAAVHLRENQGSLVAMHEADEPAFREMGGAVDFFLDEGDLKLSAEAKTRLQILHSPGHTQGHVTLYWPEQKVLIAGDCIFYRSTGRTDFPGGDGVALRQSIDRLSRLDIEYLLCGHAYGNPGILKGKEAVQENFQYIKAF